MKKLELNRNQIKYIAMIYMIFGHLVFNLSTDSQSVFYQFVWNVGRFVCVVFLYLALESLHYTKDRERYLITIFTVALITQLRFLYVNNLFLNTLFTILFCLLLYIYQETHNVKLPIIFTFIGITALILCYMELWGIFFSESLCESLIFTGFYMLYKKQIIKKYQMFLFSYLAFLVIAFVADASLCLIYNFDILTFYEIIKSYSYTGAGYVTAWLLICIFYNDKALCSKSLFHKWSFYVIYPLHGVLILIIRSLI